MAAKLRSVIGTPILRSALKAVVLAGAVSWVRGSDASFASAVFFCVLAVFLYLRPTVYPKKLLFSSLTLLSLVFLIPVSCAEWLLSIGAGILFFLILAIKEISFFARLNWYYLLHFSLLTCVNALFLSQEYGLIAPVFAFITIFALTYELYDSFANIEDRSRKFLIAGASALISLELLWMGLFLPISFLQAGALVTVIMFMMHELFLFHLRGVLTQNIVFRDIGALVGIALFLFLMG